jgi:hypothetical protein
MLRFVPSPVSLVSCMEYDTETVCLCGLEANSRSAAEMPMQDVRKEDAEEDI